MSAHDIEATLRTLDASLPSLSDECLREMAWEGFAGAAEFDDWGALVLFGARAELARRERETAASR